MSGKHLNMRLEFWVEVWAGDINFRVIIIQWYCKTRGCMKPPSGGSKEGINVQGLRSGALQG